MKENKIKVCQVCGKEISKKENKKLNILCRHNRTFTSYGFEIKEISKSVCNSCKIDLLIEYFKPR